MKVCICTTYPALAEPRARRYAAALARMNPNIAMTFVDCVPRSQEWPRPPEFQGLDNLAHRTHYYAHRKCGASRLIWDKLILFLCRSGFRLTGFPRSEAIATRAVGLATVLKAEGADVYVGHNIDTLIPVCEAAKSRGAAVIFDAMEFYSDMLGNQSSLERDLIRSIERRYLPRCSLVLTPSEPIAQALRAEYGIERLLRVWNAAPIETRLPAKSLGGFSLYWRNAVVDLGPRGLEDVLLALNSLPADIHLYLQGRVPSDGGRSLLARLKSLGLDDRVTILPPFPPEEAVLKAAPYAVGLCLEPVTIRNSDLTISNKLFDYLMAGLAIVASNTTGQTEIVRLSNAGLIYRAGDPFDLAERIMELYHDPRLLNTLQVNARSFALREGNLEHELQKLIGAFRSVVSSLPVAASTVSL